MGLFHELICSLSALAFQVFVQTFFMPQLFYEVRHFSSDAEVIAAAETWLDGQHSDFFCFEWLAKVRATG
jgi:hypothetical protein